MFTKEHYVEIAKILKENRLSAMTEYPLPMQVNAKIVQNFVSLFEKDSSNFDAERFLDAIYGKEEKHEKR